MMTGPLRSTSSSACDRRPPNSKPQPSSSPSTAHHPPPAPPPPPPWPSPPRCRALTAVDGNLEPDQRLNHAVVEIAGDARALGRADTRPQPRQPLDPRQRRAELLGDGVQQTQLRRTHVAVEQHQAVVGAIAATEV